MDRPRHYDFLLTRLYLRLIPFSLKVSPKLLSSGSSIITELRPETLARWIGNYLTKSSGVKVVFRISDRSQLG